MAAAHWRLISMFGFAPPSITNASRCHRIARPIENLSPNNQRGNGAKNKRPQTTPGAFVTSVRDTQASALYRLFLTWFGCFAQSHLVENLCLAVLKVLRFDFARCELLVEDAEFLEQRVLVRTVV